MCVELLLFVFQTQTPNTIKPPPASPRTRVSPYDLLYHEGLSVPWPWVRQCARAHRRRCEVEGEGAAESPPQRTTKVSETRLDSPPNFIRCSSSESQRSALGCATATA